MARSKKTKNRNVVAIPARKKKAGKMKDRRVSRSGAKNLQQEFLDQNDDS